MNDDDIRSLQVGLSDQPYLTTIKDTDDGEKHSIGTHKKIAKGVAKATNTGNSKLPTNENNLRSLQKMLEEENFRLKNELQLKSKLLQNKTRDWSTATNKLLELQQEIAMMHISEKGVNYTTSENFEKYPKSDRVPIDLVGTKNEKSISNETGVYTKGSGSPQYARQAFMNVFQSQFNASDEDDDQDGIHSQIKCTTKDARIVVPDNSSGGLKMHDKLAPIIDEPSLNVKRDLTSPAKVTALNGLLPHSTYRDASLSVCKYSNSDHSNSIAIEIDQQKLSVNAQQVASQEKSNPKGGSPVYIAGPITNRTEHDYIPLIPGDDICEKFDVESDISAKIQDLKNRLYLAECKEQEIEVNLAKQTNNSLENIIGDMVTMLKFETEIQGLAHQLRLVTVEKEELQNELAYVMMVLRTCNKISPEIYATQAIRLSTEQPALNMELDDSQNENTSCIQQAHVDNESRELQHAYTNSSQDLKFEECTEQKAKNHRQNQDAIVVAHLDTIYEPGLWGENRNETICQDQKSCVSNEAPPNIILSVNSDTSEALAYTPEDVEFKLHNLSNSHYEVAEDCISEERLYFLQMQYMKTSSTSDLRNTKELNPHELQSLEQQLNQITDKTYSANTTTKSVCSPSECTSETTSEVSLNMRTDYPNLVAKYAMKYIRKKNYANTERSYQSKPWPVQQIADEDHISKAWNRLETLKRERRVNWSTGFDVNRHGVPESVLKIGLVMASNLPTSHLRTQTLDPLVKFQIYDMKYCEDESVIICDSENAYGKLISRRSSTVATQTLYPVSLTSPSLPCRSTTKRKMLFPVWNEMLQISPVNSLNSWLYVRVVNSHRNREQLISETMIPLSILNSQELLDNWFPLHVLMRNSHQELVGMVRENCAIRLQLQLYYSKIERQERKIDDLVNRYAAEWFRLPSFIEMKCGYEGKAVDECTDNSSDLFADRTPNSSFDLVTSTDSERRSNPPSPTSSSTEDLPFTTPLQSCGNVGEVKLTTCSNFIPRIAESTPKLVNTLKAFSNHGMDYVCFDKYSPYHPRYVPYVEHLIQHQKDSPHHLKSIQQSKKSSIRKANFRIFKRPTAVKKEHFNGFPERLIGLDNQTHERLKRVYTRDEQRCQRES